MPLNLQDIINLGLVGSGSGGSSGGGGGGSAAVSPKDVNFYDYDGTCVHAYTVAEAQALSELPAGPEHPGLVFQGWNWSLENVKALTRPMNIGAMYTTDDGTTRLYITLQEGRTSPMLGVGVNGTVTVDWGDGTEPDVLTGTSIESVVHTPGHAYPAPGEYVIQLSVDGEAAFCKSGVLSHEPTTESGGSHAYISALRRVEFGEGLVRINDESFSRYYGLRHVVFSEHLTYIGQKAFQFCRCLEAVIVPRNTTKLRTNACNGCYALNVVSLPYGLTEIEQYCFEDCHVLDKVTLPDTLTSLGQYAFQTCESFKTIELPTLLTRTGNYICKYNYSLTHVNLPDNIKTNNLGAFGYCTALVYVRMPKNCEQIYGDAFYGCTSAAIYDFTSCNVVPNLSSANAFTDIPADCEIRVPAALYDEWIAATNWATYAANIKAY